MGRSSVLVLVVGAACGVLACAKTSGNSQTNQTLDDCNDVIDALSAAFVRCGHDEDTTRQEQLDAIVGGDCVTVTSVRDHGSLQNVCLGSLKTIDCTQLEARNLDDSCKLQLLRPTPTVPP